MIAILCHASTAAAVDWDVRARHRRAVGAGVTIAGIVSSTIGLALGIAFAAQPNSSSDIGALFSFVPAAGALIGQGTILAAAGAPVWAVGGHDLREGGAHALEHARMRRKVGWGLLASGLIFTLSPAAMALPSNANFGVSIAGSAIAAI